MFNRGLANVVTVVLVILIGLVVLGIGWNVVVPLFEKTEGGLDVPLTVNLDIVQGTVRTFNGSLEFYVERKSGQGEVVGVNVVMLSVSGTSETRKVNFVPMIKELEKRKVRIYHRLGDLAKVSIAPIYRTSKGEVIGNVVSSRVIPLYDFSCGNGQLELGTEQCEDGNLNLETCNSQGYQTSSSGGLRCTPQCTFDYTFCGPPLPGNTNVLGSGICDNGVDDDFDGFADFPQDPGCASLNDGDEADGQRNNLSAFSWSPYNNGVIASPLVNIFPAPKRAGFDASQGDSPSSYVTSFYDLHEVPDDKRALILYGTTFEDLLANNSRDHCQTSSNEPFICLWWNNGVGALGAEMSRFLTDYPSSEPPIKYLIIDLEGNLNALGNFQIGANYVGEGPNGLEARKWQAISSHNEPLENYEDIERRLEEINNQRDFNTLTPNPVHDWTNVNNYPGYIIWNVVMNERVAGYLTASVYDLFNGKFNGIKTSQYGFTEWSSEYAVPDLYGHNVQRFGSGKIVGTHQSPWLYGFLNQISNNNGPTFDNGIPVPYTRTAFNAFRYEINKLRATKLSSDKPLMPWVAFKGYLSDSVYGAGPQASTNIGDTPYYDELIIHTALVNPEVLLYFNNGDSNGVEKTVSQEDDEHLDSILKEFNQVAGFSGRQTLVKPGTDTNNKFELTELTGWTENYVLTGMTSGDRNVWRLTPNEGYNLNTHEENNNLIVQLTGVNGKTFTFEQGKVYRLTNGVSSTGIWIVQPTSTAMPTIS